MASKLKKFGTTAVLFVVLLACVLPMQIVKAQNSTTVNVVPQTGTHTVGQTITITIQINNVQNLYALEVILDFNNAVLQLTNQQPDLGTSNIHGGGVLYGSPLTTDINNLQAGGLYFNTSLTTSSEYYLYATSANPAQAFSGSGTIVTLTFQTISSGQSPLTLTSTLADHPAADQGSNPIDHNDISGTVTVASTSASSTPISSGSSSPTAPSTSSTNSATSNPTATPSIPEISSIAVATVFFAMVVATLVVAARRNHKPNVLPVKSIDKNES